MNHQQCFVVGVSSRGTPIEGSRDHFAVVDHGELVMDILEMLLSAWFLRDAQVLKARVQAALADWTG